MATQVILLSIVLASTIVGTTTNPAPWVKICIIALAVASAAVSLLKAYGDEQDSKFIKGALAAELASTKPTAKFDRAFAKSLGRVARTKGMRLHQAERKEQGTLYFLVTEYTNQEVGVVHFSADQQGQAYVNFVSNQSMDKVLGDAIFKVPVLKSDEAKADLLEELGFVGNIAISRRLKSLNAQFQITQNYNYDPLQVGVIVPQASGIHADLSSEFISSILSDPPFARNWKAYQEFERQLAQRTNSQGSTASTRNFSGGIGVNRQSL